MNGQYVVVPVAQIRPSRANVRADLGDLRELSDSVKAHGLLQPLVITASPGEPATVIDGHRRLAAAKLAGLSEVPCLLTERSGRDHTLTIMLAASLHKQLEPLEQAEAFSRLLDMGMTRQEISGRTGYSRSTVDARLSLLGLPTEARRMVVDRKLSLTAATNLARQVKRTGSGSVANGRHRAAWFTPSHPLAAQAGRLCQPQHAETYQRWAGACGRCWEAAIRADAS